MSKYNTSRCQGLQYEEYTRVQSTQELHPNTKKTECTNVTLSLSTLREDAMLTQGLSIHCTRYTQTKRSVKRGGRTMDDGKFAA